MAFKDKQKEKDGQKKIYCGRVRIQGMPTVTQFFEKKKDAKNWEDDLKRKFKSGSYERTASGSTKTTIPDQEVGGNSVGDLIQAYLNYCEVKWSPKHLKEKQSLFRRFRKIVNVTLPATSLTPALVLKFLSVMKRAGRSGNSVNKDRKNLHAMWEWGTKFFVPRLPRDNPVFYVEKFASMEHPRYIPPLEDFWKVYYQAGPRDQLILLTHLNTLARRTEIFRLKKEDLDLEAGNIYLTTKKTMGGSENRAPIPIPQDLVQKLKDYLEGEMCDPKSPYVFPDPDTGEPYRYRLHFMRRLCKKAGVPRFGLHAIRHLGAQILGDQGVPIRVLQEFLRHQRMSTTDWYQKKHGRLAKATREAAELFPPVPKKPLVEMIEPKNPFKEMPDDLHREDK